MIEIVFEKYNVRRKAMRAKTAVLLLALGLPLASRAGFQEFTVHFKVEPKGKAHYKVPQEMIYYMDGNRMRQDIVTQEGRAVFVMELDGDKLVSTMIDPDEKTYMRNVSGADEDVRFLFAMPRGEESPCKDAPDKKCKRLGTDRLQGYRVIKWQITEDDGKPTVYWYAPKLGFFLKSESDEMIMTATRIEDRAPPASKFEPPAGYREIKYGDFLRSQGLETPSHPGDASGAP